MGFEKKFFLPEGPFWLVASDEAGRGPLAGPVVAGAVAIKVDCRDTILLTLKKLRRLGIKDSKQMNQADREAVLAKLNWSHHPERALQCQGIGENVLATWSQCTHVEIDQINILQASLKSMHDAAQIVSAVENLPVVWLIDGNKAPKNVNPAWNVHPVVKGDAKSVLIGLASVIAKVTRDRLMQDFHQLYPQYGFDGHAGYPTPSHRKALLEFGPSPIHRQTFGTVKGLMQGTSAGA